MTTYDLATVFTTPYTMTVACASGPTVTTTTNHAGGAMARRPSATMRANAATTSAAASPTAKAPVGFAESSRHLLVWPVQDAPVKAPRPHKARGAYTCHARFTPVGGPPTGPVAASARGERHLTARAQTDNKLCRMMTITSHKQGQEIANTSMESYY